MDTETGSVTVEQSHAFEFWFEDSHHRLHLIWGPRWFALRRARASMRPRKPAKPRKTFTVHP